MSCFVGTLYFIMCFYNYDLFLKKSNLFIDLNKYFLIDLFYVKMESVQKTIWYPQSNSCAGKGYVF